MPSAFLKSPRPFGRPAGRAPCVSFQALFARPVWRPWLEWVWNASLHLRGAHALPTCTAPMGAGRLQEQWELWSPSREPPERFGATSEQERHWQWETRFARKELTALYTPWSNNSLLQLPGWGASKGTWQRRPWGKDLLHQSPRGHKHVWFPCEEAKAAWAESLTFWVTCLLHSLSFLKH